MDASPVDQAEENASSTKRTLVFPEREWAAFAEFVDSLTVGAHKARPQKYTNSEVVTVAVRVLRAVGPEVARTFVEKYWQGDDDYFERIGVRVRTQL